MPVEDALDFEWLNGHEVLADLPHEFLLVAQPLDALFSMDYEFVNRKGFEINGLDGAKDQLNWTAGIRSRSSEQSWHSYGRQNSSNSRCLVSRAVVKQKNVVLSPSWLMLVHALEQSYEE